LIIPRASAWCKLQAVLTKGLWRQANWHTQPKVQMRAIRGDGRDIKLGTRSNQTPADFQPFIE
jgi:hypothetical protein